MKALAKLFLFPLSIVLKVSVFISAKNNKHRFILSKNFWNV